MTCIGSLHLAFALSAMVLGAAVLLLPKGTKRHRRFGIGYVLAMVGVNVSAFAIYRLFGGFGPFHVAAVISSATLCAAMFPLWFSKSKGRYLVHMGFMYWSVAGLYAAFVSETLVRMPGSGAFWMVVSGGSLAVFLLAAIGQRKAFQRWTKELEKHKR